MSINEEGIFSCSAYNAEDFVWIMCLSSSSLTEDGTCINVKDLITTDSNSTIDPFICFNVKPVVSNLTILIKDDLHLINDLNNSLVQCLAFSFASSEYVNSSSARLLLQGKLKAMSYTNF